jgi:hypothetical protein
LVTVQLPAGHVTSQFEPLHVTSHDTDDEHSTSQLSAAVQSTSHDEFGLHCTSQSTPLGQST